MHQALRRRVHRFFVAWQEQDRSIFPSFWSQGAVQWRKETGNQPVLSKWTRSFHELGGTQWIYGIRALQTRDRMAFVEVEAEHICKSTIRPDCGRMVQTFVWQLDSDGHWRILQHEIGTGQ